jgi:hypothetical protein
MSDRYNQYRILYSLYDEHFNGQTTIINERVFSCSLASIRTFFCISCSIRAVPMLSKSLDSFMSMSLIDCRNLLS